MITPSVIRPTVAKGFAIRQMGLGTDSYDLAETHPPDTGVWQSKVLDLGSPKFQPNKTYIFDRSRYNNHGTITQAIWTRLPSGLWYLYFDGTDDIVNIPNHASLNPVNNFTLMGWIRVDRTTAGAEYDGIICKRESTIGTGYMIYTAADKFSVDGYATGNNLAITASVAHTLGVWYLVAMAITAGVAVLYINGVSRGTDTCNDINVNAGLLRFSTYDNTVGVQPSNPFQGGLALVRLISLPLTASQLLNIFNQERHLFGV